MACKPYGVFGRLATRLKASWLERRKEACRHRAFRRLIVRGDVRLLQEAGMTREEVDTLLEWERMNRIAERWNGLGGRAN